MNDPTKPAAKAGESSASTRANAGAASADEPPRAPRDPRLAEVERLIATGDWEGIVRVLGSDDEASALPPTLGLVWALARRESMQPDARGGSRVTELAVRFAAGALGVEPNSDVALVVAKRLLRQNPRSWQQRPAPSTGMSILIMIAALIVGSAIGLLVSGMPLSLDYWR